jgi:hypothetical protein
MIPKLAAVCRVWFTEHRSRVLPKSEGMRLLLMSFDVRDYARLVSRFLGD